MATLYELTGDALKLRELMAEGELDLETIKGAIDNNTEEIGIKLESYAKVLKDVEGDIAALKTEEARLAERRKSYENNIKRLKSAMQDALLATGERKIKSTLFTFYMQNNAPSVVIDEAYLENIPECFLIPQEPKIDKAKLKVALESDDPEVKAKLEGIAHLETSESIRIK